MSSEGWRRGREIFEQALERPIAERQPFLEEICATDVELLKGVQSLLEANDEAGSFLDQPLAEPPRAESPSTSPNASEPDLAQQRVGPYRLLRQIGRGGMGTVYLASRDDDAFQRRVAIKLVRGEAESGDLLRRLRTERQILASLDHPHIARLYDGGTTQDHRPYFVMEYVEGVPIDAYCDLNQLSIDQRLDLFQKVCMAVHYAHQNLVVHRDLKPSNILVGVDGEPKLLDFGIAKLLNPELSSSEAEQTATWLHLLTPNYGSPEQIRGKLITTVSDVYSLGVVLYQLLTGHLPYQLSGRSLGEMEEILTQREPLRPSTMVVQGPLTGDKVGAGDKGAGDKGAGDKGAGDKGAGDKDGAGAATIHDIARGRRARPAELSRQLAGDLDSIVLKALRSSPQRRYSSVEHLKADLERCQQGLPVLARQGSWRYRAGKLLRRNRLATAVVTAIITMIFGFALAMAWQSARMAEQLEVVRQERDKTRGLLSLMLTIFRASDPDQGDGSGKALTVFEALELSGPRLELQLRGHPVEKAEILHTKGLIYLGLGEWRRARDQLEQALDLRLAAHGRQHPEVAASMAAVSESLRELGFFDKAEPLALEAVEITRRIASREAILVRHINTLVTLYCYYRKYDKARPLALEALTLARASPEGDPELLIDALGNMATVRYAQGEYPESAKLYRQVVTLTVAVKGEIFPPLADWKTNLGLTLRRMDDLEGAEEAYREALELQQNTLGPDHPRLASVYGNLGGLQVARGNFVAAEASYQQAKNLAVGDAWTFFYELRLAGTWIRQGRSEQAEEKIRVGLERWRREPGDNARVIAFAEGVLGEALIAQKRFEEAEELLVRSFEVLLQHPQQRRRQEALDRLADLFQRQGRPQDLARFTAMMPAPADS